MIPLNPLLRKSTGLFLLGPSGKFFCVNLDANFCGHGIFNMRAMLLQYDKLGTINSLSPVALMKSWILMLVCTHCRLFCGEFFEP